MWDSSNFFTVRPYGYPHALGSAHRWDTVFLEFSLGYEWARNLANAHDMHEFYFESAAMILH